MDRNRKVAALIALLVVSLSASGAHSAGFGIGASIGTMSYNGQVLPGAGDPDGDLRYGVHVKMSPIPIFDLELRGEYFKTNFAYSFDPAPGTTVNTDMEFQDFAMYLSLRYKFFSGPGVPVSLYASGGLGWHLINTEILSALGASVSSLSVENLTSESRMGWHAIVGGQFSTIGFPFAVFVEGRYETVDLEADNLSGTGVYGGLTLQL